MSNICRVKYLQEAGGFVYVGRNIFSKYKKKLEEQENCVKIQYGENFQDYIYLSLGYDVRDIPDDTIGLDPLYGKILGIKSNEEVFIDPVTAVTVLDKVEIEPVEDKDYELISKDQTFFENFLLKQVKVATSGQKIPLRGENGTEIHVRIRLNNNIPFGILEKHTELIVIKPSENHNSNINKVKPTSEHGIFLVFCLFLWDKIVKSPKFFLQFINYFINYKSGGNFKIEDKKVNAGALRLVIKPLAFAPLEISTKYGGEQAVSFGFQLPAALLEPSVKNFCQINVINPFNSSNDKVKATSTNVLFFNDEIDNSTHVLYAPNQIMKSLEIESGSIAEVTLQPYKGQEQTSPPLKTEIADLIYDNFSGSIREIFKKVETTVCKNISYNQKINTLIIGNAGCGKTYILDSLEKIFKTKNIFCRKVKCKTLRKKKISTIEKTLTAEIHKCCVYQPSVMFLDDLDSLTIEPVEENVYSSLYSDRIGNMILDIVTSCQSIKDIFFIATGNSLANFKNISTDRGPIIFESVHEIPDLTAEDKIYLIKRHLQPNECNETVIEEIAERAKGYNAQDLMDLVTIAEIKARSRGDCNAPKTKEDFDQALIDKVPLSLHGVNLQKKTLTKWEDIGGMESSKTLLREMFEWPIQYQALFKTCPLRLQCGVLLYGAPGTGKTLIAGAVANEFGLNFISIKGPEIFSKYIGASEKGVRDLFARARKAAPCLLFFDEFESLAGKRGNTNENVNDRVVNQLLTELDGVEELTGVFILAATSRPDLIDPALLRPGRIDRIVQCNLPNKEERLSILKVLSKNMKLSSDVDFDAISCQTDGYSGADLRAILYAAQSALIKEMNCKVSQSGPEITVKQCHLLSGLAETKPSVSEADRLNYENSYQEFQSSRMKGTNNKMEIKKQKTMFA